MTSIDFYNNPVWEYRIIEHDNYFGIHEVYYDGKDPVKFNFNAKVKIDKNDDIGFLLQLMNDKLQGIGKEVLPVGLFKPQEPDSTPSNDPEPKRYA